MQIGVLIPRFALGGAGRVAMCEVEQMLREGRKAVLLTLAKAKGSECIGFSPPLPVLKASIPLLVSLMWGIGLKKPSADVIVAHGIASIAALRLKRRYGIPYVVYIHHPNGFLHDKPIHKNEERNILGPLARHPARLLWSKRRLAAEDRQSLEEAEHVFTNSLTTLKSLKMVYGDIAASVCYPGINSIFHSVKPNPENKENVLIYTSRHVEQKGFHLLPEILSRIKLRCRLIITGRPSRLTPHVLDRFRRKGLADRVIYRPNISDEELARLYSMSRVLLFPAIKEDFGLSPVEGMATGAIPVAWGDGGGVEETITHGVTGLLAKPYDIDDYAEKVSLLLEDDGLYSKLVASAKEFSKGFTWARHIAKILDVLEKIK